MLVTLQGFLLFCEFFRDELVLRPMHVHRLLRHAHVTWRAHHWVRHHSHAHLAWHSRHYIACQRISVALTHRLARQCGYWWWLHCAVHTGRSKQSVCTCIDTTGWCCALIRLSLVGRLTKRRRLLSWFAEKTAGRWSSSRIGLETKTTSCSGLSWRLLSGLREKTATCCWCSL